jgi:hypothetical protein
VNLKEALIAHLRADPDVGRLTGGRVYLKTIPQAKPTKTTAPKVQAPSVAIHRLSSGQEYSHDGPSIAHPIFQVDCWAKTQSEAEALVLAVSRALGATRDAEGVALDVFPGTMGGEGGIVVEAVFVTDQDDGYDDDMSLYLERADFEIWISG